MILQKQLYLQLFHLQWMSQYVGSVLSFVFMHTNGRGRSSLQVKPVAVSSSQKCCRIANYYQPPFRKQ